MRKIIAILIAIIFLLLFRRKEVVAVGLSTKGPNVVLSNRPEMVYAREIVSVVWAKYGFVSVVITSGEEVTTAHMKTSKHYEGLADDFRTKNIPRDRLPVLVNEVQSKLGSNYDVILEDFGEPNEHLHIEYDPS